MIFVDEASNLDSGHWAELATAVERHGATVRAVGHEGQHDAIRLLGLFSEMLASQRIPTVELRQIRRHRDPGNPAEVHPWLRDYQVAVDQGRGFDAVAILQEQGALKLYDTRAQAIGGIVEDWDQWRRRYTPAESALIVHGPNSDVDLVNELAQRKRLDAGELDKHAIPAVDRDYQLRPGDLVAIRNAAYTFPAQPGKPRPKRIENGADRDRRVGRPRGRHAHPAAARARRRAAAGRDRPSTAARPARRRQTRRRGPAELCPAQLPRPRRDRPRHRDARRPLVPSQAGDLRRRHARDLPSHRPRRPRRPWHRRHRRGPHRPLRAADLRQPPAPRQRPPSPRPHPPARRRAARPPTHTVGRRSCPGARPTRRVAAGLRALDAPHATRQSDADDCERPLARDPRRQRSMRSTARTPRRAARALARGPARAADQSARTSPPRTDSQERWERDARRLAALGPQTDARPAPTPHTTPRPAPAPRAASSPPTTPQPRSSNPTINRQ